MRILEGVDLYTCKQCGELKGVDSFSSQREGFISGKCRKCHSFNSNRKKKTGESAGRFKWKGLDRQPCTKCGIIKPREEFSPSKNGLNGVNSRCKKCEAARQRAYAAAAPDRRRDYWLRSTYGITLADYEILLKEQGYRCAICRCQHEELGSRLRVDHDHKTELVRGLLCEDCNGLLGFFNDDVRLLATAVEYLGLER